ncbi:unannotated protein [freshwater metagenome]|uniref:Unannotated protein n=1 Tax=freshwater metagenome TaxID=449393 RepID=A0A6J7C2G7_9ZZZZ
MDAGLALKTLETLRGVNDLAHVDVGLIKGAELGGLVIALVSGVEHAREWNVLTHHRGRHRLGDALPHREGVPERPGGVPDRRLGLDRAVGDDLGDAFLAVLLGGVADHVAASSLIEVHIDIGHRDAVGVEEPLEEEAVSDGVKLGDAEGVRDERAGRRSSARAHADPALFGVTTQVGGDEEVAREPHLAHDTHFIRRLRAVLVGDAVGIAHRETALDLLDQPRLLILTGGNRETRHEVRALVERHVAPFGDEQGVVARLGQLAPDLAHLARRLEVEVARGEAEALRVIHRGAGTDAEQDVVGVSVTGVDVVEIVGGQQWDVEASGDAQEIVAVAALDAEPVVHQLAEVVVLAEDVPEVRGCGERAIVVARLQPAVDLARGASGRADDSLAVGLEQVAVDPGLAVEALKARQAREAEQVVQTLGCLGPHGHMGVRLTTLGGALAVLTGALVIAAPEVEGCPLESALRGVVALHADDRLDPGFFATLVEVIGAVEVSVVAHREGRHLQSGGLAEQVAQAGGTVEHGVLGVHVEVHEVLARHSCRTPSHGSRARAQRRAQAVMLRRRIGGSRHVGRASP